MGTGGTPHHGPEVQWQCQPGIPLGLGRHAEGRVEPVHAVVLPRGKSLDQCAEILQKRTRAGQAGVSKPPKCRSRGSGPGGRPPPRSVFDFLNEKLKGGAPGAPEVGAAPPGRSGKEVYHASRSTKRALSLRLLQTEEKIEQTQRAIRGIQEALARNAGRYVWPCPRCLTPAQLPLREFGGGGPGLRRGWSGTAVLNVGPSPGTV